MVENLSEQTKMVENLLEYFPGWLVQVGSSNRDEMCLYGVCLYLPGALDTTV